MSPIVTVSLMLSSNFGFTEADYAAQRERVAALRSGIRDGLPVIAGVDLEVGDRDNWRHRGGQERKTGRTHLGFRMAVGQALGEMAAEPIHIQPDVGTWNQANVLPIHLIPYEKGRDPVRHQTHHLAQWCNEYKTKRAQKSIKGTHAFCMFEGRRHRLPGL